MMRRLYRGQEHVPVATPEEMTALWERQREYKKPGAISLDAYLSIIGVKNPVTCGMMKAHVRGIEEATQDDWQKLLADFYPSDAKKE